MTAPGGPAALVEQLPRGLVEALDRRGAGVESGWVEHERRFVVAGPFFGTASSRLADVGAFAHEVACRAAVGGVGPLRAPEVLDHGPGWLLSVRVVGLVPAEEVAPELVAAALDRLSRLALPVPPASLAPPRSARHRAVQRLRLLRGPVPLADLRRASAVLAEEGPVVVGHGDLHAGNVLVRPEALYVLDWETCGPLAAGLDAARFASLLDLDTGTRVLDAFARTPSSPSRERLARLHYACTVQSAADMLLTSDAEGRDVPRAHELITRLSRLRAACDVG